MLLTDFALALLALVGGMFLLSATRKDNLGGFFKGISYLVIILSFLVMVCTVTRTIMRATCHDGMCNHEMMMGEHGMKCGDMKGCSMHGMKKCCGDMKDSACDMKMMDSIHDMHH